MLGLVNNSETGLCQMALGHLGISELLGNVLTDRSAEAGACRLFYDQVIMECLRDFPHPFSESYVALNLVDTDPNSEWGYSYRYPSECLFLQRILSGNRNDTRDTRVPYRIASDDVGKLIYTDVKDAVALITKLISDPAFYTPDFLQMASLLLASYITPRLLLGDAVKLGARAHELYRIMRLEAINNGAEEEQEDIEPQSEFMRARL